MSSLKWKIAAITVGAAGLAFAGAFVGPGYVGPSSAGFVGPGYVAVPANMATHGS
jgi:hypothetical protein